MTGKGGLRATGRGGQLFKFQSLARVHAEHFEMVGRSCFRLLWIQIRKCKTRSGRSALTNPDGKFLSLLAADLAVPSCNHVESILG